MRVEVIDDTHQRFNGKIYFKNKKGYYVNNKHVLHRDVWRWHYPLKKGRDIHHRDFNKDNNQIENLQMLTRAEHAALHHPPKSFVCTICGKTFTSKTARKRCPECVAEMKRLAEEKKQAEAAKPPKPARTRKCIVCGKEFQMKPKESQTKGRKTCSEECYKALLRQNKPPVPVKKERNLICPICGKTFQTVRSDIKCCSSKCGAKFNGLNQRGKPKGEKVERVISNCELCGKEIRHPVNRPQRFCSKECLLKFMNRQRWRKS